MERIVDEKIVEWIKQDDLRQKSHSPLFLYVNGLRQVGKTYSIRKAIGFKENDFLSNLYEGPVDGIPFSVTSIYLNFATDSGLIEVVSKATNGRDLLKKISLNKSFLKSDLSLSKNHRVILFIDEIQMDSSGISFGKLREFAKVPNLIIIASGSLLGPLVDSHAFTPLGGYENITMCPITFEEFLIAQGFNREKINSLVDIAMSTGGLDKDMHNQFINYFKDYMETGGFPRIVDLTVNYKDFKTLEEKNDFIASVRNGLISAFEGDIAKYAPGEVRLKAEMLFTNLLNSLAKERGKFYYSSIGQGVKKNRFEYPLNWLISAGLVFKVQRLKTLEDGLAFDIDEESFKLYYSDMALIRYFAKDEFENLIYGSSRNKGPLFENVIGIVLRFLNPLKNTDVYYYSRKSGLEIDFMMKIKNRLCAIEVKSSENTQAKSLSTLMKENPDLIGIKVTPFPYSKKGNLINVPYYLAPFLDKVLNFLSRN